MTKEEETKYYIALYGYVPWTISIAFSLEDGMEWDSAEIAKQLRMAQAKIDELTLRINEKNTWVGLTFDEILSALESVDPDTKRLPKGLADFAYAVEAKLKEKNGG